MKPEIEAKFLNIEIETIREQLKEVGAHLERPMRLMRRHQFDHPDHRYIKNHNERLRVRDEGDKITVTYKNEESSTGYANEIETVVGSYDAMKELLLATGLIAYAYQETRRETWLLDGVEIVIDEWPWAKPYIEIEGPTEESIKIVASKLGFNWADAKYGSVDTVYAAQYPKWSSEDTIGNVTEVKFDAPLPDYLKARM